MQVPEDLLKTYSFADDQPMIAFDRDGDLDLFREGRRANRVHRSLEHANRIDRFHLESEFAGDDAGNVQQFVDDRALRGRVSIDHVDTTRSIAITQRAALQQMGPTDNCIEWSAKLMREHRQKLVLHAVRNFSAGASLLLKQHELLQFLFRLFTLTLKFNVRLDTRQKFARRKWLDEIIVGATGEGIAPDFLPYIFERFRQADSTSRRKHGGLGVGLSIVRNLVELHGGEVQVTSDGPGKGATFTIRLPIMGLSDADAAQRDESKQLIDSRWKQKDKAGDDDVLPTLLSGLKVLAVDDQQDTRDLIMLALMRYGAEVRASDSATAALATIAEWQPNVIVSDIGLPEMDGYDFMRALRKIEGDGKRIPAIALTGYAGVIDESNALNAGYELHFSKPINLNELAHAIAKLSGKK